MIDSIMHQNIIRKIVLLKKRNFDFKFFILFCFFYNCFVVFIEKQSLNFLINDEVENNIFKSSFLPLNVAHAVVKDNGSSKSFCKKSKYPKNAFRSQPDNSKIYLRGSHIDDVNFNKAGITGFCSVFGIRILYEDKVPIEKILHLAKSMAELLDKRKTGKPTNSKLVNLITERHAILIIVLNDSKIDEVIKALPEDYSCSFYMIVESSEDIVPKGELEPDCPSLESSYQSITDVISNDGTKKLSSLFSLIPSKKTLSLPSPSIGTKILRMKTSSEAQNSNDIKIPSSSTHMMRSHENSIHDSNKQYDRTVSLIAFFIIQSGYPLIYPSNSDLGRMLRNSYNQSIKNGWFIKSNIREECNSECQEVAFQSLALSSALGVDQCRCRKTKIWLLCTPQEIKKANPEFYGTLTQHIIKPSGNYIAPNVV